MHFWRVWVSVNSVHPCVGMLMCVYLTCTQEFMFVSQWVYEDSLFLFWVQRWEVLLTHTPNPEMVDTCWQPLSSSDTQRTLIDGWAARHCPYGRQGDGSLISLSGFTDANDSDVWSLPSLEPNSHITSQSSHCVIFIGVDNRLRWCPRVRLCIWVTSWGV